MTDRTLAERIVNAVIADLVGLNVLGDAWDERVRLDILEELADMVEDILEINK